MSRYVKVARSDSKYDVRSSNNSSKQQLPPPSRERRSRFEGLTSNLVSAAQLLWRLSRRRSRGGIDPLSRSQLFRGWNRRNAKACSWTVQGTRSSEPPDETRSLSPLSPSTHSHLPVLFQEYFSGCQILKGERHFAANCGQHGALAGICSPGHGKDVRFDRILRSHNPLPQTTITADI